MSRAPGHGHRHRAAAAPLLLLASSALLVRLVVSGDAALLVRTSMVPLMVVAAAVLAVLAVAMLVAPHDEQDGHGHDASGAGRPPRLAWLLLAPVAGACLLSPAALAGVADSQQGPAPPAAPGGYFPPLPPGDPLTVPLNVYADRALLGGEPTLRGRTVLLVGFVAARGTTDGQQGWVLSRLRLRCCLADARAVKVRVLGVDAPAPGTWVQVRGHHATVAPDGLPLLEADDVTLTAQPAQPSL